MTSFNEGLLNEGQCYIGMGIYNDEGPFCETVLNCARSDVIKLFKIKTEPQSKLGTQIVKQPTT